MDHMLCCGQHMLCWDYRPGGTAVLSVCTHPTPKAFLDFIYHYNSYSLPRSIILASLTFSVFCLPIVSGPHQALHRDYFQRRAWGSLFGGAGLQ